MSDQIMRKFNVAEEIDDIIEYKQIKMWCNEYTPIEEIIDDLLRNTSYQEIEYVDESECAVCHEYFNFHRDMIVEINPFYTPDGSRPKFTPVCLKCKCLRQQSDIDALSDEVMDLMGKVNGAGTRWRNT
ncbi:MAG: hypothetical protein ACRCX2_38505 [Paraclostridium sp.]